MQWGQVHRLNILTQWFHGSYLLAMWLCIIHVASYPGLFAPTFCHFLLYSCEVAFCTAMTACLMSTAWCLGLWSVVYSLVVFPGICHCCNLHPRPVTSLHMMSFTRPSHVSTASDQHWGRKAWVRGYRMCMSPSRQEFWHNWYSNHSYL